MMAFTLKLFRIAPRDALAYSGLRVLHAFLPAALLLAGTKLLQEIESRRGEAALPRGLFLLAGVFAFAYICDFFSSLSLLRWQKKIDASLHEELYACLAALPYPQVEDKARQDQIGRLFRKPDEKINKLISSGFKLIETGVSFFSFFLLICGRSPWIGGGFLLLAGVVLYLAFDSGRRQYDAFEEEEELRRRYDYAEQQLLDRETCQERNVFHFAPYFLREMNMRSEKLFRVNAKPLRLMSYRVAAIQFVSYSAVLLFALFLWFGLRAGKTDGAFFVAAVGVSFSLIYLLSNEVFWTYSSLIESLSFAEDYRNFTRDAAGEGAETQAVPGRAETERSAAASGAASPSEREARNVPARRFSRIEFRRVTFTYPGAESPCLRDLSLCLDYGKTQALVGENGSGKSTVVKLLLGLYRDYEGEILIDGREVRDFRPADLHAHFAVAFQDFVKMNIPFRRYVRAESEAELREVQNLLRDLSFSETPLDGDTLLGKLSEDSVELSGGQWQKLLLARVLLQKEMFKILDEPTSAVDPNQERLLYRKYDELSGHEGSLLITHRLAASVFADQIYVLKDGAVAESGTHEQLLARRGIYAEMFETQRRPYEE